MGTARRRAQQVPVMKSFVVLAFAAFLAGHQAAAQQIPANVDLVKDAFWEYVAKATLTAEETLKMIQASEMGKELDTRIAQSADAVNKYTLSLQSQATPLTQELIVQLSQQADLMKSKVEADIKALGAPLEPYVTELTTELNSQMEELKKELTPYAEALDPENLHKLLHEKSLQVQQKMDQTVMGLQETVGPL